MPKIMDNIFSEELDMRAERLIGNELSNQVDALMVQIAQHAPAELVEQLSQAIFEEKISHLEVGFFLGCQFSKDPASWVFQPDDQPDDQPSM